MTGPGKKRLAYIDWLRGLACVLMMQGHSYDSWLSPQARSGSFYGWSQFLCTFPAPLFLFLAGISIALVMNFKLRKGVPLEEIANSTILRGLQIFALALVFRVQEYLLGLPGAPWTDLFRVDVLNTIGLSIVLLGLVCRIGKTQFAAGILASASAAVFALVTPPLWTTWRPTWLPWYIESYVNGVHIYDKPQTWLFPIFPWAAFAFAGLAVGFLLFSDWATRNPGVTTALFGVGGIGLLFGSLWLDTRPVQLYAVYDYWHTSPNFFLARLGILLILLFLAYAWCQWGAGQWGFSPVVQLGQTSLLVYWVHLEFVYGRFSILGRQGETIPTATLGFIAICIAMVLLSLARTKYKGRGAEILSRLRRIPSVVSEG